MPYAVGRLYVSENFDSNSKKAVEDMVQNIRDEFRKILTKVDWMDTESKKEAYAKVFILFFMFKFVWVRLMSFCPTAFA